MGEMVRYTIPGLTGINEQNTEPTELATWDGTTDATLADAIEIHLNHEPA